MNIIFFGTPGFAAQNLEDLYNEKHNILAVITIPDTKKGRGKKIIPPEVKKKGEELGITVLQPENLENSEFTKRLASYNADLFIVVAFRILPESIFSIPKKGTINLHTSLLPNYRGAAPINRVLINNEKETGITTFLINKEIDGGKILDQEKIQLDINTTAAQLHNTMMKKGSNLLIKTIEKIEENTVEPKKQDERLAISYAKKITKETTRINWDSTALEIHNLIRGLSPYINEETLLKDVAICPSAWFILKFSESKEIRMKLIMSTFSDETNNQNLMIETDNKTFLKINLRNGSIDIKEIQVAGKSVTNIKQFLSGYKLDKQCKIL